MYTQTGADYVSVKSLLKTIRLPATKVRWFLRSKLFCKKLSLATRKFKRMKAYAIFNRRLWCMDMTIVEKLADDKGVKNLLVPQDVFDETVDAKGVEGRDSKESVQAFLNMIIKVNWRKKFWFDKRTEFKGELKKVWSEEGVQKYSTLSETKAAFAERTIRSLKNFLTRYMEDHGYNYVHKLCQFVANLNSREN